MAAREAKVESYLDQQVKSKLKGITRKWENKHHAGVPDRIVFVARDTIFAECTIFVEIKTVTGELSSFQKREHLRLQEYDVPVITVYGREGVDHFINDMLAYGRPTKEEYR